MSRAIFSSALLTVVVIVGLAVFQSYQARQQTDAVVRHFVEMHASEIVTGNWRSVREGLERFAVTDGIRNISIDWSTVMTTTTQERRSTILDTRQYIALPESAAPVVSVKYELPFRLDRSTQKLVLGFLILLGIVVLGFNFVHIIFSKKLTTSLRNSVELASRLSIPAANTFNRRSRAHTADEFEAAALATTKLTATIELATEKAVGLRLSNLHHDFASPVTALEMGIRTLQEHPSDTLAVTLITQAFTRIKGLHDSLSKSYSKIESKKQVSTSSLEEFIRQYTGLKQAQGRLAGFRTRNWSLNMESKNLPESLPVEQEQFFSAIGNLLDNAEEITRHEGTTVAVAMEVANGNFIIEISDDGCGISERKRIEIEGGTAQSRHHEGTGLGVQSIFKLAEDCGGSVTIRSPVERFGCGTAISLMVPLNQKNEPVAC